MQDETQGGENDKKEVAQRKVKAIGMAIGRIPSGLYVVTVKHEEKEDATLVSWVTQCGFSPPTICVALGIMRPTRLLVEASGVFVLNVLGKAPNNLLKHFLKPPAGRPIFEGLQTRKGINGINILTDAVGYMECKVTATMPTKDHVVYFGEVTSGRLLRGGDPHTHVRGSGYSY